MYSSLNKIKKNTFNIYIYISGHLNQHPEMTVCFILNSDTSSSGTIFNEANKEYEMTLKKFLATLTYTPHSTKNPTEKENSYGSTHCTTKA